MYLLTDDVRTLGDTCPAQDTTPPPGDALGLFQGLGLAVPVALGLWTLLIWGVVALVC